MAAFNGHKEVAEVLISNSASAECVDKVKEEILGFRV